MIYRIIIKFFNFILPGIIFIHFFFFNNELKSLDKFEGLIVKVNSSILTTYDLSQRIKLALKALELEDNISNRDNVRERVLELLIIEKIKKSQAIKENIEHTENELIEFAAMLYNFPKNQFDDFKLFITLDDWSTFIRPTKGKVGIYKDTLVPPSTHPHHIYPFSTCTHDSTLVISRNTCSINSLLMSTQALPTTTASCIGNACIPSSFSPRRTLMSI